jgi:hypothetical protein
MGSLVFGFQAILLGCSDNSLSSINDVADGDPAIDVFPDTVDFGALGLGDEPVVKTFTIESVGDSDLEVQNVALDEYTGGAFRVLTDVSGVVLPRGATKDIEVEFYPLIANDNRGISLVWSNDPMAPTVPVDLLGTGDVPELQIDPDPMDVGATFVGCPEENHVDLINVGNDTLVVSEIEQNGESFALLGTELPLSIAPGESVPVSFSFDPADALEYSAELGVTSNEPLGFRTGAQVGLGKFSGDFEDTWEIPEDQPTDVLFLVDQSCSMDDNAAALGVQFQTYIDTLTLFTGDWQIIIANRGSGCNHTGILTPSTPGYDQIFQAEVNTGDGELFIDDPERLLTAAANSVELTDPAECNAGFMRDEAILHVIAVSDEPEQSIGGWEDQVNRVVAAKGSTSMTRISAIAGRMDGVCGNGGVSEPGTGYNEAVAMTGGVYLDICSDWSKNMEALALASAQRDTFELSNTPVDGTIQVYVNGNELAGSAWEYRSDSNSVVVVDPDRIPTSGDLIDITYGGAAPCDQSGD